MNNCILMAEITQAPELRYTADNQTPIAEFLVKFPGPRENDAPGQLKVVGWGNLAQEIQSRYGAGDRVLLEGRLSMNTFERPEGFKEKRAEMTVQRINPIGALQTLAIAAPAPLVESRPMANQATPASVPSAAAAPAAPAAQPATSAVEYDDIPF